MGALPGLVVEEGSEAAEAEEAALLLAAGVEFDGRVGRGRVGVLEEAGEVRVLDARGDFGDDALDRVRVERSTAWVGPLEREVVRTTAEGAAVVLSATRPSLSLPQSGCISRESDENELRVGRVRRVVGAGLVRAVQWFLISGSG